MGFSHSYVDSSHEAKDTQPQSTQPENLRNKEDPKRNYERVSKKKKGGWPFTLSTFCSLDCVCV